MSAASVTVAGALGSVLHENEQYLSRMSLELMFPYKILRKLHHCRGLNSRHRNRRIVLFSETWESEFEKEWEGDDHLVRICTEVSTLSKVRMVPTRKISLCQTLPVQSWRSLKFVTLKFKLRILKCWDWVNPSYKYVNSF